MDLAAANRISYALHIHVTIVRVYRNLIPRFVQAGYAKQLTGERSPDRRNSPGIYF